MLLFLLSCFAPADTADTTPRCDVGIVATDPADGSTGHHYREPIAFTLDAVDDTANVFSDVAGETSFADDGLTVLFTPSQPLEPNQEYTVTLDYCRAEAPVRFTTSAFGAPMDDPNALAGAGWSLDPAEGRYLDGEGVGEVMSNVFGRHIMVEVLAYNGGSMDIRAAVSETGGGDQELCRRTNDIAGLDTSNLPYFRFEADELSFDAYETGLNLLDFHIDGTFSSDGTQIEGATFGFRARINELAPILNQDADELCELAEQLGVSCEVCGGQTCIAVSADRLSGVALTVPLVEVLSEDISPDCVEE